MSVEVVGWAFRQNLPPKPKIVLLALADQTDETTGRVCYGKTAMKHLAKKCSVGERTLYRYLAALIRNGYAIRQSGKAKGHENELWLCLDRPQSRPEDWKWTKEEVADESDADDAEPQDVGEGSAILAEGEEVENGRGGLPHAGRAEESFDNQRTLRAREGSFDKSSQALEVEASEKRVAEGRQESVFVVQGTPAWEAWNAYLKRTRGRGASFAYRKNGKTGREFPSLYPPKATVPPSSLMTEQDESDAANMKW